MSALTHSVTEGHFSVPGGLPVFYRDHQPATATTALPLVYLPGLMRTARDFDMLAARFAEERRVVTIDTRGRGKGGRSEDPADYDFDLMIADVWALLDHLDIPRAVFAGLALGAFMSWRMAAAQPGRVAGIIANDTGTETVSNIGKKMVALADQGEYSFEEAVQKLTEPNRKNFLDFGPEEWRGYTRQVYAETAPGKWKRDFHPGILAAWAKVKETVPSFWPEFVRIGPIPVLILRGENSEYLSQEQASRMAAALEKGRTVNVQQRAHPLLLSEPASLAAIRATLAEADAAR